MSEAKNCGVYILKKHTVPLGDSNVYSDYKQIRRLGINFNFLVFLVGTALLYEAKSVTTSYSATCPSKRNMTRTYWNLT